MADMKLGTGTVPPCLIPTSTKAASSVTRRVSGRVADKH